MATVIFNNEADRYNEMQGSERERGAAEAPAQIIKRKGISSSTLKLIAVISMLIDHTAAIILGRLMMNSYSTELREILDANVITRWLTEPEKLLQVYWVMRYIGRLAFPIYCFLLVEGFQRTRNIRKYIVRLGLFALVSEIPFNLAITGGWMSLEYQNVFFTLLIGLLVMAGMDAAAKAYRNGILRVVVCGIALAAGCALATLLSTDYGAIGVLCITVLYVFRNHKPSQMAAGCACFLWELTAPLAFLPISFYNGERGMKLKYFFYAFYPVHLLVLYLICCAMGIGNVRPV